jgi:hypothetical protein
MRYAMELRYYRDYGIIILRIYGFYAIGDTANRAEFSYFVNDLI